jgi:hypothetical protein
MKKVLVIIGQHRSGTSLLSGSLKIMGGWLGPNYEFEADQYNSKGYFENRWTDTFNNRVLGSLGSQWYSVAVQPLQWWEQPNFNPLLEELKGNITRDINELPSGKFYMIKDPRISLILPLYVKAFKQLGIDAQYIFSDRETDEIVDSVSHRDGLSPITVRDAVIKHRTYAKPHLNDNYIWTNTFANMLYKPEKFLNYIKNEFGLPITINEETLKGVNTFVEVGLKNQNKEKNCKVIATYFGPRRTNINFHNESVKDGSIPKVSGSEATINAIVDLIKHERAVDSGVFMDTIIVNHDISEIMNISKAKELLDSIDGTPTKNGVIKVLNRPWDNGIGGSFGSFNHVYQELKEIYDYWFFTEDNVIQTKDGYFGTCIDQLKGDDSIGFICGYRYTTVEGNKHHAPHCHGGCGATHISKLNEVNDKYGSLPYSKLPFNNTMVNGVGDNNAFNGSSASWYRKFEEDGEVGFTHVYVREGYSLKDIDSDDNISCYYADCY